MKRVVLDSHFVADDVNFRGVSQHTHERMLEAVLMPPCIRHAKRSRISHRITLVVNTHRSLYKQRSLSPYIFTTRRGDHTA